MKYTPTERHQSPVSLNGLGTVVCHIGFFRPVVGIPVLVLSVVTIAHTPMNSRFLSRRNKINLVILTGVTKEKNEATLS